MPASTSEEEGQALFLTMSVSTSEEKGQGLLLATSGVYLMPMAEEETPEHDELKVTRPQTVRHAVTVEGDQAVFLRLCRL